MAAEGAGGGEGIRRQQLGGARDPAEGRGAASSLKQIQHQGGEPAAGTERMGGRKGLSIRERGDGDGEYGREAGA